MNILETPALLMFILNAFVQKSKIMIPGGLALSGVSDINLRQNNKKGLSIYEKYT